LAGWASRHETTVHQLRKCPSFRSRSIDVVEDIDFELPSMPAVMVTRSDAQTYCVWLNQLMGLPKGHEFRLPCLKEWRTIRPENASSISSKPAPVDTSGSDSRGFFGVIGNVWEITSDGCACGGSWLSESWEYAPERPVEKMAYSDSRSDHNVGFRIVLMPVND
jgi:formylglycine-generating enzyme required for sulfatase activity